MIQSKTYNDHQRMIEQFVNQENLPEALNQYKEALQLNSDPENYSNLGVILVQQGLLEELLSIYPTVMKNELSRKRSYYRLGLSLGEQGLFNEALICFEQASNKQLNGDKSYDRIWKYLNECDLEEEFNPNHINIKLNDTYTYFHEISRYKIINLLSIAEEDKSYFKNQNISLDNLCLILEENPNLEEIYANSVNYNPDKIQKLSKLVNKKSGFTWELLNPKHFQQSIIETGYIYTVCPFTGEVLKSNQSFYIQDNGVVPLCFYRFQGREVFYLVVGGWSGGKVVVYFPKTELIVLISNEWGMWLKHEEYLNKFKAHLVSNWQDVKSYISLENKDKKITSISGMIANLGHYFWNELTAIQYLYDNQILDRVDQFLTGSDSRLDLHDLFPEISPEKIRKVENKQDFFQIILKNNLFAVRLTDFSIQESLVQRIYNAAIKNCNEVFLQQIEEAKTHFPLLWINLRGHNKSWISQVEGYANIISELSKEYPNLAIIFDGFSTEKDTMEKIIQQIPSTVKIYDGLNCSIQETLVWAFAIDTYISIIGSGLTLVTWIANKPGVAHSDRAHYSQIQMFAEARDNAIAPSYVPLEYIIDIQDGREGWLNYECDWKAIYNEIVNVIRSLKNLQSRINKK